ncbi:uncharacterized protein PV06_08298 [Exophiala oligosperma]|uniref:Aminoglycoside phosphotransferase domain-containing protein n=1 Tax=Exophiala oligosperma TaxID=215243 RepID=A0A0D2DW11_9EURO|nr:uncharacterized protein PV06_08298 [Exophiala oligosperma]KIW39709.1 hypothetical protein PV06_08298 [Exophiala oligosperma]
MESTAGEKKRRIEDQGDLEALVRVLQHFATVRSPTPGPLAGPGPAYALLFGDSDLLDNNRAFAFSPSDICLCHLDFFPHNIKWQRGEPPCALDWLSAGFWPHIFEKCSHLIIEDGSIPVFGQMWFPGTDCEQIVSVVEAWSNIRRDHFWAFTLITFARGLISRILTSRTNMHQIQELLREAEIRPDNL